MKRFAVTLSPLVVGLLLPIWTIWYIGPWEATGQSAMIWSALRMLPDNVADAGLADVVFRWHASNLIRIAALLALGIGIGWHYQKRQRARAGKCQSCGYDLRATPGRCPECGSRPGQVLS